MKRNFLFIAAALLLFLLILLFPSASIEGANKAIQSWLSVVIPGLMPFFIAASILSRTGVVELLSGLLQPAVRRLFGFPGSFACVFLMSAISGYPMGARLVSGLYAEGKLAPRVAQRMVNAASTSGPLFLIGSVCTGMLGRPELAVYLLLPHYLAAALVAAANGLPFRRMPAGRTSFSACAANFLYQNPLKKTSVGQVLAGAVSSAVDSMLMVGGFMVLYSVFLSCLASTRLIPGPALPYVAGALEMATGCLNSDSLPLTARLIFISAVVSFGGLSVHSQTHAAALKGGLRLKGFFPSKCAQGALAAALTWGMLALFPPNLAVTAPMITQTKAHLFTGIALAMFSIVFMLLLKRNLDRSA